MKEDQQVVQNHDKRVYKECSLHIAVPPSTLALMSVIATVSLDLILTKAFRNGGEVGRRGAILQMMIFPREAGQCFVWKS
jgi:hypothetical protein